MFIDNKYVTDVYAKGSQKWPYSGPHGLLWEGLAARLRDRRGALTVEKVPSHAPERLMEGKTPVTGYSANFVADILAGTGAERNQLPPSLLKTIDEVDKEARQVQRHLVGVLEWIGEQAELPKGSIILTKTLDQLKEQSEHQVAEEGEFLTCGLCKQGRHQDLARRWLRGVCMGTFPSIGSMAPQPPDDSLQGRLLLPAVWGMDYDEVQKAGGPMQVPHPRRPASSSGSRQRHRAQWASTRVAFATIRLLKGAPLVPVFGAGELGTQGSLCSVLGEPQFKTRQDKSPPAWIH